MSLTVYRWGPPPDAAAVARSVVQTAQGEVDAVLFTSAPGAAEWIETARREGVLEAVVQRSADGVFVVMHDSYLDRTTTCRGRVAERTLAQLKACHLVVEGTGDVTSETVPTLEEALLAAKDHILLNIDNKLDVEDLPAMTEVARRIGVARQVIVKQNLWSEARIVQMRDTMTRIGTDVHFMPILADDAVRDAGFIEAATRPFAADAVEMVAWRGDGGLTESGGVLFSARARAVAARGDWHLWVNTYPILNKASGYVRVIHAAGLKDGRFRNGAPYDLILANILPRPLVGLATDLVRLVAPGGTVVLSGIIPPHANLVISAYRDRGLRLVMREEIEGWVTLTMRRGR